MANTVIQVKRANQEGAYPNTTDPSNGQYIAAGELALNMADGILYTSNGGVDGLISVGAKQRAIQSTKITVQDTFQIGDIETQVLLANSTEIFAGNTSTNVTVSTALISVQNTTSNSSINAQKIFVGNNSVNAQFNLVGGNNDLVINSFSYDDSTGISTFGVTTPHHLVAPTRGTYVTIYNVTGPASAFNGSYEVSDIPDGNTFTVKGGAFGQTVDHVFRHNGQSTLITTGNHNFSNDTTVNITGVGFDYNDRTFTFDGTYVVANTIAASNILNYNQFPSQHVNPTGLYKVSGCTSVVIITSTPHNFQSNYLLTTNAYPSGVATPLVTLSSVNAVAFSGLANTSLDATSKLGSTFYLLIDPNDWTHKLFPAGVNVPITIGTGATGDFSGAQDIMEFYITNAFTDSTQVHNDNFGTYIIIVTDTPVYGVGDIIVKNFNGAWGFLNDQQLLIQEITPTLFNAAAAVLVADGMTPVTYDPLKCFKMYIKGISANYNFIPTATLLSSPFVGTATGTVRLPNLLGTVESSLATQISDTPYVIRVTQTTKSPTGNSYVANPSLWGIDNVFRTGQNVQGNNLVVPWTGNWSSTSRFPTSGLVEYVTFDLTNMFGDVEPHYVDQYIMIHGNDITTYPSAPNGIHNLKATGYKSGLYKITAVDNVAKTIKVQTSSATVQTGRVDISTVTFTDTTTSALYSRVGGQGTNFTSVFKANDVIQVDGQLKIVRSVPADTELTVWGAFTTTKSFQTFYFYTHISDNYYFKDYRQSTFPNYIAPDQWRNYGSLQYTTIQSFTGITNTIAAVKNIRSYYKQTAPLTIINSTAFEMPLIPGESINTILGTPAKPIPIVTGRLTRNTDVSFRNPNSPPAKVTISAAGATSGNVHIVFSSYVEVVNSSAAIRVTPSTFYNGNTTSNLFSNSTTLSISSTTDIVKIAPTEISLTGATNGIYDPSKNRFFVNSSLLQIGTGKSGIEITAAGKIQAYGSQLIIGTEISNVYIDDVSLAISGNNAQTTITPQTAEFAGDVSIFGSLYVNSSPGEAGQVLTTDGMSLYWSEAGLDFSSDQTFQANITVSEAINANIAEFTDSTLNHLHIEPTLIYYTANTNETLLITANTFEMISNDVHANGVTLTSTFIGLGNGSIFATVNSTIYTGSANNVLYVGNIPAVNIVSNAQLTDNLARYQTTAGLSGNVAKLTANSANNASYLGTVAASNYVNTSGSYTLSGVITHTGNLVVNTSIIAGGNSGTAGQVLASNGSGNVYWMSITAVGSADNANNASYLNTKPEANLNVNSALTANNSNYFGGLAGNTGSNGQILTSNGSAVYWSNKYTAGSLPPDYPNYGDVWYYTDMEKLFMWINDGGSDYWYDFLPPAS